MANEIIIVGAGPIGLWTAVQIKLQNPDIKIVFKEKYTAYKRLHTLKLEHSALAGCKEDDDGVIRGLLKQLKQNPHIRTDVLEDDLLRLARKLGIEINYEKVENVERIWDEFPEAAMVIGADGVNSQVREQIFGANNVHKTPLAYSAQIKYFVNEDTGFSGNSWVTYPLLKQSNFLSFVSVGKKQNGKTPVTIQHIIDKPTYEAIKGHNFNNPVRLFVDNLDEMLPEALRQDIKTHVGIRLANNEDIFVESVNLTATELPQQRCDKVVLFQNDRCHALIGDAALGLSFFKGMNSGLQLATQFSKEIIKHWEQIIARDETALKDHEQYYDKFAEQALNSGHHTQRSLQFLEGCTKFFDRHPLQLNYYSNAQIATYHRQFDQVHRLSQFYLVAYPQAANEKQEYRSLVFLKNWLEHQMNTGLPLLRIKVLKTAEEHPFDSKLHASLLKLAQINTTKMSLFKQADLAIAMSKVCDLLDEPTDVKHQKFVEFVLSIKTPKPGFYHMLSAILEIIAGVVAVALGIVTLGITGGASAPVIALGALAAGHGIFQLTKNLQGDNELSQVTENISNLVKP